MRFREFQLDLNWERSSIYLHFQQTPSMQLLKGYFIFLQMNCFYSYSTLKVQVGYLYGVISIANLDGAVSHATLQLNYILVVTNSIHNFPVMSYHSLLFIVKDSFQLLSFSYHLSFLMEIQSIATMLIANSFRYFMKIQLSISGMLLWKKLSFLEKVLFLNFRENCLLPYSLEE